MARVAFPLAERYSVGSKCYCLEDADMDHSIGHWDGTQIVDGKVVDDEGCYKVIAKRKISW